MKPLSKFSVIQAVTEMQEDDGCQKSADSAATTWLEEGKFTVFEAGFHLGLIERIREY